MNKTSILSPSVQLGTHFSRELFMLAFCAKHEIMSFVRSQCIREDNERMEEILDTWERLQPRVRQLVQEEKDLLDAFELKEIPAAFNDTLREFSSHPLFKSSFSFSRNQFAMVEIDKLVAAQRTVNLDHVERLINRWGDNLDLEDLLTICLSPEGNREPVQHLEAGNNTHVFSSPDPDIRYLGTYMKQVLPEEYEFCRGGHPVAAVVSLVGYGSAPVNVLNGGTRLILNNGFHRVYALRALGIKEIPVVVQNFENIELEFPSRVVGLHKDYLLGFKRPVIMKDFFEQELMMELKVKEVLRTIQIHSGSQMLEIPS